MRISKNFSVLIFFIIHFSFITAYSQSWQELMDSTNSYSDKQDFPNAKIWCEKALEQAEKDYGKSDTNYAENLNKLSEIYDYLGNPVMALALDSEAIEIFRLLEIGDHPNYALCLGNIAIYFYETGNYTEAEKYYLSCLDMQKRLYKGDHTDIFISLNNLGYFYNSQGKYDLAEKYYKDALAMNRRLYKGDNPNLASCLSNFASFYEGQGKYAEAEPLYKETLEMSRHLYQDDNPDLAKILNNISSFYYNMGQLDKAKSFLKEALDIRRRIYSGDNPDLAVSLNNLAYMCNIRGEYSEAEKLFNEALQMDRRLYNGDNVNLSQTLSNLANFYENIGRYSESELLYTEALEMTRRLFSTDNPHLATVINNCAVFYEGRGDFTKAEPLYKEALEMSRRIYSGDHPNLAATINNTASFYENQGKLDEAGLLYKEALDMRRRLYKSDHPDLVISINNMAYFLGLSGKNDEAFNFCKEALDMSRRLYPGDNPTLAQTINNLAVAFKNKGDYFTADSLYNEARNMYMRIFKGDHPMLATCINNIAILDNTLEKYDEAEKNYLESLEMGRRLYNYNHPSLAYLIFNCASFYQERGKYSLAENLYKELFVVLDKIIKDYFPSLSEKEKDKFFETVRNYFDEYCSFVSNVNESDSTVKERAVKQLLNNLIFSKSLILSSTAKVSGRILNSGDKTLIENFRSWKDLKDFIGKSYSLSKSELENKHINLDSLENLANEKEKYLSKTSEDFTKEYERKKIEWQDVQKVLKPSEALVEIVRFKLGRINKWTDSVYYGILILKNNNAKSISINSDFNSQIKFLLLKNGIELEKKYLNNYKKSILYKIPDIDSYAMYWEPIAKELKGITKVYISPDGVYNQINLNTLFNNQSKKYILDETDIRLLSGTRDLAEKSTTKKTETNNNIVELFGDPKYNLDKSDSITITDLPETRKEIEMIKHEMKFKNWIINTHLGDSANEESVKALLNPIILHIATHGKFLSDVDISSADKAFGLETSRMTGNPLLRSFMIFAGAGKLVNSYNQLNSANTKSDDGLLTAYEAMNLELDNTDLVVLSACETGLGDIKNGEGVYGLQRAFIQAGAKSLIMSLWKVNDVTTQQLMTTFYKKWLNGKTKRQAFKEAQLEIKKHYPEPFYWGAFVLVGE